MIFLTFRFLTFIAFIFKNTTIIETTDRDKKVKFKFSHKIESLHRPVDFVHDILRPALRPDAEMPLGPFDRVATVGLLGGRFQPFSLSPFYQG